MREVLVEWLPWLMSAATVYTMILAGNKAKSTWAVAIASQVIWAVWIVASESWGLIPGHIALWWVYVRNFMKWRIER